MGHHCPNNQHYFIIKTIIPIPSQYGYRISAYSFRGNYSFLNLTLCTVTFDHSTYRCGNYSREETIQGRKLFAEIRYASMFSGYLIPLLNTFSYSLRPLISKPLVSTMTWIPGLIFSKYVVNFAKSPATYQPRFAHRPRFAQA